MKHRLEKSAFVGLKATSLVLQVLVLVAGQACEGPSEADTLPATEEEAVVSAEQAMSTPTTTRPLSVPVEYVATPNGYSHPSCVIELRDDDLLAGDIITRADGRKATLAPCLHPRFDRAGKKAARALASRPPEVDGWAAWVSSTSAGAVQYLSATWAVPQAPALASGQTLYFFPGLVPAATSDTILQPVLAWNGLYAGAGWSIYSWNCCRNGNELHSAAVNVSTGETISGYVSGSGCNTTSGVCSSWQIRTSSTTQSSTLNTDAYGEVLDWEFSGAFEAYNLTSCSQLPRGTGLTFQNVAVARVGGNSVVPTWTSSVAGGLSPACSIGATNTGTTATVQWCIPTTSCSGRCGTISDGCGGTVSCPACSPYTCPANRPKCCEPGTTRCLLCVARNMQCP